MWLDSASAVDNIGIGDSANESNTGAYNIAVGLNAFVMATSGSYNVALGNGALGSNSTGNGNVSIGYNNMSPPWNWDDNLSKLIPLLMIILPIVIIHLLED